jgi:hypothetical protein
MTEPGHCPRRHVVLTADAPAGLCPSCLMQLALELTIGGPDQSFVFLSHFFSINA